MLALFERLFRRPPPEKANEEVMERLNALAPIKLDEAIDGDTGTPATGALSFINREAVLNRDARIAGYEFSLHARLHSRFTEERASVRRVYDDLLIRSLTTIGVGRLLGHRLAFVDISPASLGNAQASQLSAANTVLMLSPTPAELAEPMTISAAVAAASAHGYRMGLCLKRQSGVPEAISACDWVQIDTSEFDGIELASLVGQLRAMSRQGCPPLQIVATHIATADDFQHCFKLPIDLFQGPFITSREKWLPPKSDLDRARVIIVLNKLRSGGSNAEIAALMRNDPVLTFKFLRYINSAAVGLQTSIGSLEQGLILLGSDQFYRWLSLLLFDVKQPGYVERSLMEQALVRARFMEYLAAQVEANSAASADVFFLTGLFSLLDQIMGQPIASILTKFSMADAIRDGLLKGTGPTATLLKLSLACERGDQQDIATLAALCGLDSMQINMAMVEALGWVQAVTESLA